MGVLPLQFTGNDSAPSLGLKGDETIDILGLANLRPQQDLKVQINYADGRKLEITVKCRIDTPIEIDYYRHGGILPYVLREILERAAAAKARAA
jgi:aconitate hydratase